MYEQNQVKEHIHNMPSQMKTEDSLETTKKAGRGKADEGVPLHVSGTLSKHIKDSFGSSASELSLWESPEAGESFASGSLSAAAPNSVGGMSADSAPVQMKKNKKTVSGTTTSAVTPAKKKLRKPGWLGDKGVTIKRFMRSHLGTARIRKEEKENKAKRKGNMAEIFDTMNVRGLLALEEGTTSTAQNTTPVAGNTPAQSTTGGGSTLPSAVVGGVKQIGDTGSGVLDYASSVLGSILDVLSSIAEMVDASALATGAGIAGGTLNAGASLASGGIGGLVSVIDLIQEIKGYVDDKDDWNFLKTKEKIQKIAGTSHQISSIVSNLIGGAGLGTLSGGLSALGAIAPGFSALSAGADVIGAIFSIVDHVFGMVENSMKFANSQGDLNDLREHEQSIVGNEVEDRRLRNMITAGKARAQHDKRDAVFGNLSEATGTISDVAGATSSVVGAGLGFVPVVAPISTVATTALSTGTKLATGGAQKMLAASNYGANRHFDRKAERKLVGNELRLSAEEKNSGTGTQTESYAGLKEMMYELVAKKSDNDKMRYTKSEIKKAMSLNIAGVKGGRKGLANAVKVKYVNQLTNTSGTDDELKQNKDMLNALGLRNSDAKAKTMPSKDLVAQKLGYRGKDLNMLLEGTEKHLPNLPPKPTPKPTPKPKPSNNP